MKCLLGTDDWEVIYLTVCVPLVHLNIDGQSIPEVVPSERSLSASFDTVEADVPDELVARYLAANKEFEEVQHELSNILGDDARDAICR